MACGLEGTELNKSIVDDEISKDVAAQADELVGIVKKRHEAGLTVGKKRGRRSSGALHYRRRRSFEPGIPISIERSQLEKQLVVSCMPHLPLGAQAGNY